MSQIEVISFGEEKTIRHVGEVLFAKCVNYYSVNGPILLYFLGIENESCFNSF